MDSADKHAQPSWLPQARAYYSRIDDDSSDPVSVFSSPLGQDITASNPGVLRHHLRPEHHAVRVLNANDAEEGIIRPAGVGKSVLISDRALVWTLSVRSVVRKSHKLQIVGGESWTFDTPFFWWSHLRGSSSGATRLVGSVGPTKRFWLIWIEPAKDADRLLAAIALMHRSWWRW